MDPGKKVIIIIIIILVYECKLSNNYLEDGKEN